jgi:virulence-associated protein VapD
MYAITFDISTEALRQNYSKTSPGNAYTEIGKHLATHGFSHKQGSVYFGNQTIDAVKAVMAAIELSEKLPWFAACVSDIRMLKILDDNNLMPAIVKAASIS